MRDDQAILLAISNRDEEALVELMQRYREPVYRLAYRYVGNGVDAANLAEEVFEKIYFNAHKYKPWSSARSWIFTIAANLFRDFLRRERRQRQSVSLSATFSKGENSTPFVDQFPSEEKDGAESAQSGELLDQLRQAIRDLPEKLRFPFIYCVLEENSQDSAAEVLHISRKSVESRIYRARKQLQTMLVTRT